MIPHESQREKRSLICANGGIVIERYLVVMDGYLYAKAACWLPLEPDTDDLNGILVRTNREIWGIKLYVTLGVLDCNARLITTQKAFPLAVSSIEPAKQWIEQQTDQAVATIKQVIAEYHEVNNAIPQFDPVLLNLSDEVPLPF